MLSQCTFESTNLSPPKSLFASVLPHLIATGVNGNFPVISPTAKMLSTVVF
jgi:hypothetical protein